MTNEKTARLNKARIVKMTETAVLTAIVIIMAFTPAGYLKVGVVSISFLTIPVALGAVLVGPGVGAFLGFVFGITSFAQCFGMDAFGTMLASSSVLAAIKMFVVCVITRTLAGLFAGLIGKGLRKVDKTHFFSYFVPCLCTALFNTVLFVGTLWLLFRNDPNLASGLLGDTGITVGIVQIFTIVAGVNALIEIPCAAVIGTAITIPVDRATAKLRNS